MSVLFVNFFFNKFTILIILMKLFLNSRLGLIQTVKFVKQLFKIQIQTGGKVLLWNQVKSRMEACYSELVLVKYVLLVFKYFFEQWSILVNLIQKIGNFRLFLCILNTFLYCFLVIIYRVQKRSLISHKISEWNS